MPEVCNPSMCLIYVPNSLFCSHHLTVETIPELNDSPTPLSQDAQILHVVPHQLPQGRKLFTTTQVIVIVCFSDPDVNYLINMPVSADAWRGQSQNI